VFGVSLTFGGDIQASATGGYGTGTASERGLTGGVFASQPLRDTNRQNIEQQLFGAFAFATGVGQVAPTAAVPLRALAALVAYSRVHTGVHYPGDAIVGSLIGGALAQATVHALDSHGR